MHRAEHPEDPWSGQMSFPGGRAEPDDPDLRTTALRETREETGSSRRRCASWGGSTTCAPAPRRRRRGGRDLLHRPSRRRDIQDRAYRRRRLPVGALGGLFSRSARQRGILRRASAWTVGGRDGRAWGIEMDNPIRASEVVCDAPHIPRPPVPILKCRPESGVTTRVRLCIAGSIALRRRRIAVQQHVSRIIGSHHRGRPSR